MRKAIALSLIFFTLFSITAEGQGQRPNIIVVFIDDMGWGDLSCFGNTDASTPNIDQLADEGLTFNKA